MEGCSDSVRYNLPYLINYVSFHVDITVRVGLVQELLEVLVTELIGSFIFAILVTMLLGCVIY